MKQKILKWLKEDGRFLLILSALTLIVLYQFVFLGKDPFFANDSTFQYHLFYEEWIRLLKGFLKHGEFPFYSFYSFLGTDFWASKGYYCAFDVFLPLLILFHDVRRGLVAELFCVIVLSGFNFRFYLKKRGLKEEKVLTVLPIVYALSGIASMYFGNPMYHRFYCFLPLLFAGVEAYLSDGSHTLFIVSVFVLFLQNYYFMYPTSFFLMGYFIASAYAKKRDQSIWQVLEKALPLIGYYLIGVAMSMVMLLPSGLYMLKNSRAAQGNTGILFEFKSYVGLLFSYLCPPFNIYTDIPFMFYGGSNSHYHWYSLYLSCLGALPLVHALFHKKREEISPFYLCYLVYFVILCIKPLNNVVHLFSGASFRWVFVLDFLNLYLLADLLEKEALEKKDLTFYGGYLALSFVLLAVAQLTQQVDVWANRIHLLALLCGAVLSLGYLLLLVKGKKTWVLYGVVLEVIFSSMLTTYVTSGMFENYREYLNRDVVQYYYDIDETKMFRMYFNSQDFPPTSILNLNQSLHYRYLPTSTYDSTYESSLNGFLDDLKIDTTLPVLELKRPDVLRLLGVKYYAIIDGEELPEYEPGYSYAFEINHFHIYQLNDFNSLGHTFSHFVKRSDFEKSGNVDYQNELIIKDEDYALVEGIHPQEKEQLIVQGHTNNSLDGYISVNEKCVLFTSLPYSSGWKITDVTRAEEAKVLEVDGGFLGIVLEAGEHQLHYQYTTPGFKAGLAVSALGTLMFVADTILVKRRKKRFVKEG